jgi:type IV secretory pathway TrbD component
MAYLPVFVIFTPVMLIFGPRTHQLSKAEIAGAIIFSLLGWIVGGYLFGLSMWKTFDKKYR